MFHNEKSMRDVSTAMVLGILKDEAVSYGNVTDQRTLLLGSEK